MIDSPTGTSLRSRLRFGLYGVVAGLVVGVPVGVQISTSSIWLRSFDETFAGIERQSDSSSIGDELPFNLSDLAIPRDEIIVGGPRKDGIPAIFDPKVEHVSRASLLHRNDRVVGVNLGGEQRAYPIRMLNWHEIVNDTIGLSDLGHQIPIAVIYCPLCDSVSVIERRIDGQILTFGVSGLLYNSNLLMYDHQSDALWSQLAFGAVSGPRVGRTLRHLPWEMTTFGSWSDRFPGATSTVATFETGHVRSYDHSPYASYFAHERLMFPVSHSDDRLAPKEPVIGVRSGGAQRAYTYASIRAADGGRLTDRIGGEEIILAVGDDGMSVAVVAKPERAEVIHTFWFAWVAFYPRTELVRRSAGSD